MAYNVMGVSDLNRSDYRRALKYFELSLKISDSIGDKKGIGASIGNIGNIYKEQGAYPKALDHYQRSLKISKEIGNIQGSAAAISNIGNIYYYQGDLPKALDYYQRSLKIYEETGNKQGSAYTIHNIGIIYSEQGDSLKALDYYQRSLTICENIGNDKATATSLSSIASVYAAQGDYPKALDHYQRGLNICEKIGDKWGLTIITRGIGYVHNAKRDYAKALEFCNRSLVSSKEIGALKEEKQAYDCLYATYKAMGKSNEALVYLEKLQAIVDSLNAAETTKILQQMEFTKQVLADSIATAEKERLVEDAHREEVRKQNRTRNMMAGGGVMLMVLAGGLYGRVRYIRRSKAVLQVEKDRSENLLLNILPADIAAELKEKGRVDAQDFDLVSILFTDFKGFTAASEKLSAQELVAEINSCFEAFDGIMGKYTIEKIKTIGDAYMAAGGLPVTSDASVKNTVLAALEMQLFIAKRKADRDAKGLPAFEMRVGIHTGPIVAGIVGVRKFQYDIWGDTVNTASRMESNGEIGKVNISQTTYELLKADPEFAFESRGKIEAKGKGELDMWFVSLKAERA
ncbi:MAG: tetratricopeptide repeat protein [Flavobacteriales bacterium]|nr:tetratricopeptide repeat protein [Flavobacteriales bacterium]